MGKSWKKSSPKKSEADGTAIRSVIARAAKTQKGAGVHKDRRAARGGSKNLFNEFISEYLEEDEETYEEEAENDPF
jgi:hypothetical protein